MRINGARMVRFLDSWAPFIDRLAALNHLELQKRMENPDYAFNLKNAKNFLKKGYIYGSKTNGREPRLGSRGPRL